MNTQQIAERLAALCEKGEFETAQQELYGENVISIEPYEMPGYDKETKGKEAVFAKIKKFDSNIEETYSIEVSKPLIANNAIAFTMTMDVKMKGQDRMKMDEICVYEVKDGKIVSERFFV